MKGKYIWISVSPVILFSTGEASVAPWALRITDGTLTDTSPGKVYINSVMLEMLTWPHISCFVILKVCRLGLLLARMLQLPSLSSTLSSERDEDVLDRLSDVELREADSKPEEWWGTRASGSAGSDTASIDSTLFRLQRTGRFMAFRTLLKNKYIRFLIFLFLCFSKVR